MAKIGLLFTDDTDNTGALLIHMEIKIDAAQDPEIAPTPAFAFAKTVQRLFDSGTLGGLMSLVAPDIAAKIPQLAPDTEAAIDLDDVEVIDEADAGDLSDVIDLEEIVAQSPDSGC